MFAEPLLVLFSSTQCYRGRQDVDDDEAGNAREPEDTPAGVSWMSCACRSLSRLIATDGRVQRL